MATAVEFFVEAIENSNKIKNSYYKSVLSSFG